jgi:hypothetical protein
LIKRLFDRVVWTDNIVDRGLIATAMTAALAAVLLCRQLP